MGQKKEAASHSDRMQCQSDEAHLGDLTCSICLEIFVAPMQCKQGHVFCKACIERTLKKKKQCPMDRSRLQVADLSRALLVENMISRKRVRCPHASQHTDDEDGCGWVGKVSERQKHLADECEHTLVPCPHASCEVRVQRRVVSEHVVSCEQRVEECALCGEYGAVSQRAQHEEECPMGAVVCPRAGCDASGVRKDAAEHEAVCPMVQLRCVFEVCGCTVGTLLRKDVAGHERDAAAVHAALALAAYRKAGEPVQRSERASEERRAMIEWKIDGIEANIVKGNSLFSRPVTVPGGADAQPCRLQLKMKIERGVYRFSIRNRHLEGGCNTKVCLDGTAITLLPSESGVSLVKHFSSNSFARIGSSYGWSDFVSVAELRQSHITNDSITIRAELCITPVEGM
eukprot:Rhum_TRINITY_DN15443_c3_g3::Rhum_TRINITY_DN15443_c3_g3_i4::g.157252::m.157252